MCAAQLEANASLLETMRDDSSSINTLAAQVSITTHQPQKQHKLRKVRITSQLLGIGSSDKIPLKDALRSICHHSECTSKAAYHLVETAKETLDEIKNQKELMSEQCSLLKVVASNQKELAKLMKVSGVPEPNAPPPPGGLPNPAPRVSGAGGSPACPAASYPPFGSYGTPSTPAPPAFMGFGSHSHAPPQLPPVSGRFWNYQPVVAPNLEPNESRNPPSAAYALQETPGRQPRPLEVLDENNAIRSVSPTPKSAEQTRSMNAAKVRKGWMELQSGHLHPSSSLWLKPTSC